VSFASGGCGVGAADCKSDDGKNVTEFQSIFPAACKSSLMVCIVCRWEADRGSTRSSGPFVTAVGGTLGIDTETAAPFSGGFSRYFPVTTSPNVRERTAINTKNGSQPLLRGGLGKTRRGTTRVESVVSTVRVPDASNSGLGLVRWLGFRVTMGGPTLSVGPVPVLRCGAHQAHLFGACCWPSLFYFRLAL